MVQVFASILEIRMKKFRKDRESTGDGIKWVQESSLGFYPSELSAGGAIQMPLFLNDLLRLITAILHGPAQAFFDGLLMNAGESRIQFTSSRPAAVGSGRPIFHYTFARLIRGMKKSEIVRAGGAQSQTLF